MFMEATNRASQPPNHENASFTAGAMDLQLRNLSSEETHPLEEKRVSLGSSSVNSIVVAGPDVPATQCFLTRTHQGFLLVNASPGSALAVNGETAHEKMLQPGDKIEFAGRAFLVEEVPREAGVSREAVEAYVEFTEAETLQKEIRGEGEAGEPEADKTAPPPARAVAKPGPLTGRQIGPFLVEKKLAEGEEGSAYLATHMDLSAPAVFLALPDALAKDHPAFLEEILRETRDMEAVDHPNVLRVLGAGREEDVAYVAVEDAHGITLEDLLRRKKPLSELEAVEIILQAARGLDAATVEDKIHGDLRPARIQVTWDGWVKVDGFGRRGDPRHAASASHEGRGTDAYTYLSPEQLQGEAPDARSDLYALGVILFETSTGQLPYPEDSPVGLMQDYIETPIPDLSDVKPGLHPFLGKVVKKLLAASPDKRFKSPAQLVEFLEKIKKDLLARAAEAEEGAARPPLADLAGVVRRALEGKEEKEEGPEGKKEEEKEEKEEEKAVETPGSAGAGEALPAATEPEAEPARTAPPQAEPEEKPARKAKPPRPPRRKPAPTKGRSPLVWLGAAGGFLGLVVVALALLGVFEGSTQDTEPAASPETEEDGTEKDSGLAPDAGETDPDAAPPGDGEEAKEKETRYRMYWSAADAARIVAESQDTPKAWAGVIEAALKAKENRDSEEVRHLIALAKGRRDMALSREAANGETLDEAFRLAERAGTYGVEIPGLAAHVAGLKEEKKRRKTLAERKARFDRLVERARRAEAETGNGDPREALALWRKALACADAGADRDLAFHRIAALSARATALDAVKKAREAEARGKFHAAHAACLEALDAMPDDPEANRLIERLAVKRAGKPALVVVILADELDADEPGFRPLRAEGTLVPALKTMWKGNPGKWMGEFLTGDAFRGLDARSGAWAFQSPTIFDLFQEAGDAKPADGWLVARGALEIADARGEETRAARFAAITREALKAIDARVRNRLMEGKRAGRTEGAIREDVVSRLAAEELVPGPEARRARVREALADALIGNAETPADSHAFAVQLGAHLLADPAPTPRLAVFHFVEGDGDAPAEKKAYRTLWRAFRSNPYYKRHGTFVVVGASGAALFAGPGIAEGATAEPGYLGQFPATVARILGFVPAAFLESAPGHVKKEPLQGLFEK